MKKYTILIGRERANKRWFFGLFRSIVSLRKVRSVVFDAVGASTIDRCEGVYEYADGRRTEEPSVRVTVFADADRKTAFVAAIQKMKVVLDQEQIILSIEDAPETLFI